jgi:hypothetical protein
MGLGMCFLGMLLPARPHSRHPSARHVLGEGAWAYRGPATVRRQLLLRLDKHARRFQGSRGKAPGKRCKHYRRLVARGKPATVVTGAMAHRTPANLGAKRPS